MSAVTLHLTEDHLEVIRTALEAHRSHIEGWLRRTNVDSAIYRDLVAARIRVNSAIIALSGE